MSAERAVPSTRSTFALKLLAVAAIGLAAGAALVGLRGLTAPTWEVMSVQAVGAGRVAFVRGSICDDAYCETLWVGSSRDSATQVSALGAGTGEGGDSNGSGESGLPPDGVAGVEIRPGGVRRSTAPTPRSGVG